MKHIMLLRPRPEVIEYAQESAEKFKAITGLEFDVHASKNLNELASKIETGYVPIIFCESEMGQNEINTLSIVFKKSKSKPYLITSSDNFDAVVRGTHRNYVCRARFDFTKEFIFNCIRNLLTPENQKMDIRYIKSIVTSVAEVVLSNTQHILEPQSISEVRAKEIVEDIVVVSTFLGDGFLGSLTLGTTRSLVKSFAVKMLYCEEKDVTEEMMTDLIAELSNQILGAIRSCLSEFGYQLSASMHLVVSGDHFHHASSTSGHYYGLPFVYGEEKFDVTFCYNTYRTSIREIEETTQGSKGKVLDVRLVESTIESFKEVINSNIQVEPVVEKLSNHPSDGIDSVSAHVFHCANWQGCYTILMEAPIPAIQVFRRLMFGMEDNDIDFTMVNDIFGEIINQIGGMFLKAATKSGYRYHRIFHGEFAGEKLAYLYKNPGRYVRYKVTIDGADVILMFGMNSEFAQQYFNIFPYFKKDPNFTKILLVPEESLVVPDKDEQDSSSSQEEQSTNSSSTEEPVEQVEEVEADSDISSETDSEQGPMEESSDDSADDSDEDTGEQESMPETSKAG